MVKKSSTLRLDGPATMLSEEVVSSVVQQGAPANATSAYAAKASVKSTKVLTKLVSKKIQDVKDDWNWKGFGWSFYKSFLYPEAGGVSFRMPISQNFLTYFSRPWLPSINSSIGFYYPWSIGLFLSFSIPLQLYFLFLVRFAQSILHFLKIRKTPVNRVEYSIDVVQRMGVSFSWRYSKRYGYRRMVAPWGLWLPTIRIITRWLDSLAGLGKKLKTEWLISKTAGLGLTSSLYNDGLTGSVVLSLNSFFYDWGSWRGGKSSSYREKLKKMKEAERRRKLVEEGGVVGE
ncbi:hypothetical protein TrRE_jg6619 [Triparma retinervis]|uniref:Uncharacterized protein n=1 Tax=Triparma retinervis TaxID=2557542 RepID=A0A9W7L3Q5_9STRA|nr:hypothetical protein TrRE_jg6619 [Triparma retinervis]